MILANSRFYLLKDYRALDLKPEAGFRGFGYGFELISSQALGVGRNSGVYPIELHGDESRVEKGFGKSPERWKMKWKLR